jgi:predicted DNA-binding protein YlxM (UPF0122 family)
MTTSVNIWAEIAALNRKSKIVLAGVLLRQARPSIQEIACHTGVSDQAVRDWITRGKSPNKETK